MLLLVLSQSVTCNRKRQVLVCRSGDPGEGHLIPSHAACMQEHRSSRGEHGWKAERSGMSHLPLAVSQRSMRRAHYYDGVSIVAGNLGKGMVYEDVLALVVMMCRTHLTFLSY